MIKLLVITFLISNIVLAQKAETDYFKYHDQINKAEYLFFKEAKVDSCLYVYDKVFFEFNFIFVKDIINAIQISVYSGKPYEKYIELGFKHGLKISHLAKIKLLNKFYLKLEDDSNLKKIYQINRKAYLSKIDLKYLDWINKISVKDQVNKYYSDKIYYNLLEKDLKTLTDSILKRGFPGDRLIGIQDSTIFKETKSKVFKDLPTLAKKFKKAIAFHEIEETDLSAITIIPMWLHSTCPTNFLTFEEFQKQVKKGNLHPRDFALLIDDSYTARNRRPYFCDNYKFEGFYCRAFCELSNPIDIKLANLLRKKNHMCSYEIDQIKKEFEVKHGFYLFSGYLGNR